ncbi:MAG: tetratricopeptide repeat protein [Myxococcaceae bacterium]
MKNLLSVVVVLTSLVSLAGPPQPKVVSTPNGDTSVMEAPMVCPSKNKTASTLYNEGIDLMDAGDLPGAQGKFQKALELDKKYCDAMDNLGLAYRRQGNLDEAIKWYRASIAIVSKNGTARMNLGAALRMKKDYDGAGKEYAAMMKLMPDNPEGFYGLGSVRGDQERWGDAIDPMLKAEELYVSMKSPYVGDARKILGRAYFNVGKWEESLRYNKYVYAEFPNDPYINMRIGTTLVKLGKAAEGKKYLEVARDSKKVELDPDVMKQAGL